MKKIVLTLCLLALTGVIHAQDFWKRFPVPTAIGINKIITNKNNDIIVSTNNGIFRSTNIGIDWVKLAIQMNIFALLIHLETFIWQKVERI
jgi:hypothetical protein